MSELAAVIQLFQRLWFTGAAGGHYERTGKALALR